MDGIIVTSPVDILMALVLSFKFSQKCVQYFCSLWQHKNYNVLPVLNKYFKTSMDKRRINASLFSNVVYMKRSNKV